MIWRVFCNSISFLISDAQNKFWSTFTSMEKMYNTTLIYVLKMIFNTILGPQFKKYLWWKQHMTNLQMVQFVAIMVHGFQLVFYDDCDFPWQFAYYIGAHAVLFFGLFSEFYIRTYFKKVPKVKYQMFLAQFFFTSVTSEKERKTTYLSRHTWRFDLRTYIFFSSSV